jgi:hypothetical protein
VGVTEKSVPCGIVDEGHGDLRIPFGSADKPSDFLGATLAARGRAVDEATKSTTEGLQIKRDKGPESSGSRTQFLQRMVQGVENLGKPVQLLYYPPYHRKSPPIERCGGLLALPGKGTKLLDVETRLEGAKTMTWRGLQPVVDLSPQAYEKGLALRKRMRRSVAQRLDRHPELPTWDIVSRPIEP